jgi:hypothetical protein
MCVLLPCTGRNHSDMVTIEAMVCGTPMVAVRTDVGGDPE